ncbi:uncharacterized protein LOC128983278 [Macrosteles quadrilineatus]|uniref:uncharacterized protein LOC128983278 n=1 Tax=Macrosteles quadrilineatus TaxID=74068 RepID=UPI0023E1C997|nr:uncharacterized protein LOC128983278 [Macrosteles quadrilineatus]
MARIPQLNGQRVLLLFTVILPITFEMESTQEGFTYFKNLDAIKEFFEKDLNPYSRNILESFKKECLYMEDPGLPRGRRRPFIVIDGNHRACRNVVGMKLSRKLGGRYLSHPSPCLHDYFKKLSQGMTRRAFYLLSIYAMDLNVKVHINLNRPVIVNGHWLEQVVFPLLQFLPPNDDFPPASSEVFDLPTDLLAPDLVVYLDTEDNNMTKPRTAVNKRRSVKLYEKLASRYPITIQPMLPGPNRHTIEKIYGIIWNNLSEHLDFRHINRPYQFYKYQNLITTNKLNQTIHTYRPVISQPTEI